MNLFLKHFLSIAKRTLTLALITGALGLHTLSLAQQTTPDLTLGEVKKIDLSTAKITLKHEAIPALDMPPMTMVFVAQDPNELKTLNVGDTVKFKAGKNGSLYMAQSIVKALQK